MNETDLQAVTYKETNTKEDRAKECAKFSIRATLGPSTKSGISLEDVWGRPHDVTCRMHVPMCRVKKGYFVPSHARWRADNRGAVTSETVYG